MATCNIAFITPSKFEGFGVIGNVRSSENITTSGTSQASSASSVGNELVRVSVTGGSIRVLVGANPTATTASILVLENTTEYFDTKNGDKVAVIDNA